MGRAPRVMVPHAYGQVESEHLCHLTLSSSYAGKEKMDVGIITRSHADVISGPESKQGGIHDRFLLQQCLVNRPRLLYFSYGLE